MQDTKNYEEIYNKFVDYNETVHQQNQKRIRVGLRVNIFVPLVFLVLSFAINEAKLVFLILWICSLFGIAFYLMYVEYSDFQMMHRLKEFGVTSDESEEHILIGENISQAEEAMSERLDQVDNRIEEEKQRLEEEKKRIEAEIAERKERLKEIVVQRNAKEEEENHEKHS